MSILIHYLSGNAASFYPVIHHTVKGKMMRELITHIQQEGVVVNDDVLKVNSFLNHQIDPQLMQKIGAAFHAKFANHPITKILTIEASGIAPALMTGLAFKAPVVFARKSKSATLTDGNYAASVVSYTKHTTNQVIVDRQFLTANDHVLIIDDFLANGAAVHGLIGICNQAHCHLDGIGIVIEKAFQPGGKALRAEGYPLKSLVRIKSLANHHVTFMED